MTGSEGRDVRDGDTGAHSVDCASLLRLPDPGPENEGGTFDERGWYHPPCDCAARTGAIVSRLDEIHAELGDLIDKVQDDNVACLIEDAKDLLAHAQDRIEATHG